MKEMIELESQLRSWVPRRPSARLKQRIFEAKHAPPSEETRRVPTAWLAPATAALLLVTLFLNQRYAPAYTRGGDSEPLVAMIMSNHSSAAWLPGSFQAEQNNIPADTFEWTNGGASTSSIHSLSRAIRTKWQ